MKSCGFWILLDPLSFWSLVRISIHKNLIPHSEHLTRRFSQWVSGRKVRQGWCTEVGWSADVGVGYLRDSFCCNRFAPSVEFTEENWWWGKCWGKLHPNPWKGYERVQVWPKSTDTLSAFKALFAGFVPFYVAPLHPFWFALDLWFDWRSYGFIWCSIPACVCSNCGFCYGSSNA